jgi:hypothetical protein
VKQTPHASSFLVTLRREKSSRDAIIVTRASISSARPTSPNSSFDYWHDDSLDESFLAAVDDLERRAIEGANQNGACTVIECHSFLAFAAGETACCAQDVSILNRDSITSSGMSASFIFISGLMVAAEILVRPTSSTHSPPQLRHFTRSCAVISFQPYLIAYLASGHAQSMQIPQDFNAKWPPDSESLSYI